MIDILTDTETFNTLIGSNVKYRYSIYIENQYTALVLIQKMFSVPTINKLAIKRNKIWTYI